jgi:arylsulfatase
MGLALYNLKQDPGETRDLARANPEIVARLQAEAAKARADLGDSLTGVRATHARMAGNVSGSASQNEKPVGPAK